MSVADGMAPNIYRSPVASADSTVVVYRKRRGVELVMDLIAASLGLGGWALTELNINGTLPSNVPLVVGVWLGLTVLLHLIVRWRLPYADPLLLSCAIALNGLGLAMIHRIDLIPEPARHDASTQLIWTVLGMGCLAITVLLLRDYRVLRRFPYLMFLVGMALLLMPLVPGLGLTSGGSTIWIRIGHYSFQPAEAAKIVLTLGFAGYLVDRREVLTLAGRRVAGLQIPRFRDLAPVLVMWAASLAVLVFENDFGTSMLFFGLLVMMFYVATERPAWVILGGLLFVTGCIGVYQISGHVRVRVNAWLHPFDNYDQNYQVIQAQFGYAWGGLTGRGWGLGRPGLTPLAKSDFIAGAMGEELGVLGLMAIVMIYGLIVARGLRIGLASADAFGKLLATGLSFVFALQVFSIIGGVTRLLPLTGLTTPFMSQGGSSLVTNWVLIAILLVVSHRARRPDAEPERPVVTDLAPDQTQVIG